MATRETLQVVVAEGIGTPLPPIVERDAEIARVEGRASVVIGPRRCGKTYRMFQRAHELAESGVRRQQMLFVDFEDDRLFPYDEHLIGDVVDEYLRALGPDLPDDAPLYLFFDEVQVVPEWGRQIRRLLGNRRFEVMVSGSSAKMLSKEVATEFRGRGVATEMFPLSFRECLRFQGLEALADRPTGVKRAQLIGEVARYLTVGGFPEMQKVPEGLRLQLQQDLVEAILARDICQRHNLPVTGVDAFVKQALRTSGREFSVNKQYNTLKSLHVPLARDVAFSLPGLCEDAYLFFLVPRLSRSYRVQRQGVRKLYAVDPGLQFAVSPASTLDEGQRFEDVVFMHLRRAASGARMGAISTFRTSSGKEVDFAVGDVSQQESLQLVQVCVEIASDDTAKREYGALSDALDETGAAAASVVVMDATRAIPPTDPRIQVVSAWEWLLQS